MGWSSATELFDGAVDVALEFAPTMTRDGFGSRAQVVPTAVISAVVAAMYSRIDWGDWDTQDESKYFLDHLYGVMMSLGEIDED